MANLLEKMLRAGEGRIRRRLEKYVKATAELEDAFSELTDEELAAETDEFRERYEGGEPLDSLLPEAFAAVREAAQRTLGMRPYDVQIMGAGALHFGNIAEMKTGEGKTLVAAIAAYLNAIPGKGVHIITVNDYLASYQSELMGRIFRALGMTTGCIVSGQTPDVRREQYQADVTYGTNNEFGFDYLRDNMAHDLAAMVQRDPFFAIVDEVDSILIDEARTPLIISGPASGEGNRWYGEFAKLAKRMKADVHYEVDEKKRTVGVTEAGIELVEDALGIESLYESANTPLISFLNTAIKARALFKRDTQYVVMDGEVLIVDEHTGRIMPGRRFNEGIHQAIEAKEGVKIKAENQTVATITLQNYFRLYDKLAGMTGTAETEAGEFMETYKLGVVIIPTNKPVQRTDNKDRVFATVEGKFRHVAEDIEERHKEGQPILVGTTSVEKSEYLSNLLKKKGIKHEVLNAKNHAREAAIIAQAGRLGSVTVATNMAGRGTDIMLGGNAEHLAVQRMNELGLDSEEQAEEYEEKWDEVYAEVKAEVAEEAEKVIEAGGLYVLGTERHESRRIDNQLRGRSGRQGDPGASRFYLSMQDDLMRLMGGSLFERFSQIDPEEDTEPIEMRIVSKGIENAQGQIEQRNTEVRKNVLKYDDVMNRQRKTIYDDRRLILEGDDLQERVNAFIDASVGDMVLEYTSAGNSDDWDLDALWNDLKTIYPVSLSIDEVVAEAGDKLSSDLLVRELRSDAHIAYDTREEELTEPVMRQLERRVVLSVIDRKWRDHLYEMDYLREGIGLRSLSQKNPETEYQNEGFKLYKQMMGAIREESVGFLFNLDVQVQQTGDAEAPKVTGGGLDAPTVDTSKMTYSAPSEDGSSQVSKTGAKQSAASQKKRQRSGNPAVRQAAKADATAGNRAQRRASAKQAKKQERGAFGQVED
ncbi:preprotein translocase subunit SecA [uncultured Agrococcus sp.]|uniref:preprotein translocase subunit SecA n=1 Tax=uncultured Agrococcus sp. TaxID=382258 RepID=UPI0025E25680|nr:preprotein translocase subunit SecA [uncultured Agrococcus sp.]